MFILLVPLCQVAMVVCNPLFLGTYNYSLSSPLQAGQGEVKAPYCCQPQGCAIFYCIFLNPTHTFVNILFILLTSFAMNQLLHKETSVQVLLGHGQIRIFATSPVKICALSNGLCRPLLQSAPDLS